MKYQADKKSGQGTERYSTGHVYIGHFKDGRRHGQGSFFYKDGGRCVALSGFHDVIWFALFVCFLIEEHAPDPPKHTNTPTPACTSYSYVGEHAFDKADGKGKEYYKDGGRYEGACACA